jgi:hypothetical protein
MASHLTYAEREELIGISSDSLLKSKFQDVPIDTFWISLENDYPAITYI